MVAVIIQMKLTTIKIPACHPQPQQQQNSEQNAAVAAALALVSETLLNSLKHTSPKKTGGNISSCVVAMI